MIEILLVNSDKLHSLNTNYCFSKSQDNICQLLIYELFIGREIRCSKRYCLNNVFWNQHIFLKLIHKYCWFLRQFFSTYECIDQRLGLTKSPNKTNFTSFTGSLPKSSCFVLDFWYTINITISHFLGYFFTPSLFYSKGFAFLSSSNFNMWHFLTYFC